MDTSLPVIIYHYCSVETFRSMITNKCLWLSDVTKSNDKAEIRFCLDMAIPHLKEMIENFDDKHHEFIQGYSDRIDVFLRQPFQFYAMCFSKNSDTLSQWRGYADDGAGVCIGFDSTKILTYTRAFLKETQLEDCMQAWMMPVRYGIDTEDFHVEERNPTWTLLKTAAKIQATAGTFKHLSFAEEEEIRLMVQASETIMKMLYRELFYRDSCLVSDVEKEEYSKFLNSGKIKTRTRNSEIVGYIETAIPFDTEEIIQEIILGPKSKMLMQDVGVLLKLNGMESQHIKIRTSAGTYR